MSQIISRQEALRLGLSRYFTGRTCKRGHVSEYHTKGGYCLECNALNHQKHSRQTRKPNRFLREIELSERQIANHRKKALTKLINRMSFDQLEEIVKFIKAKGY